VYAVEFADASVLTELSPAPDLAGGAPLAPHYAVEEQPCESAVNPAVFATGSKDTTIALWNTFADSYK
jgi:hypothetical protein